MDELPQVESDDLSPERHTAVDKFLSWPPPGLEAVQGKFRSPIATIAIGDLILVLPLLWSAATEQDVWSFGPFGTSWWLPFITTAVGLLAVLSGFWRLTTLFRLAAKAGAQGHGWRMVVQVATDSSKDTGFLLQGARLFSGMAPARRRLLLTTRILGGGAYLASALWVPCGFAVSLLLGTRGMLGPEGVWIITVAPAAVLLLVGLLSRLIARKMCYEARRDRTLRAAVDQEVRSLVAEWNEQSASVRKDLGVDWLRGGHEKAYNIGMVCVVILAVLIAVPVITVTATGAVGAVLAAIAVPRYETAQARVAAAEMLRRYQLVPDGSVTPQQAGDALHSLLSATVEGHDRTLEHEPVRQYGLAWFPDDPDSVMGGTSGDWVIGLFERAMAGLYREEREFLATVAVHPAHAEFGIVAAAESVDVVGTRYRLPFPDSVNPFSLPIPQFQGIREGTNAHIALAAWELSRGNAFRAEEALREVVSVGFVMADEGSTILDAMIGTRLVYDGAYALERLYAATGRTGDAEDIHWVRSGIDRVLERATVTQAAFGAGDALRMMPEAVLNEDVVRGLRWEYFLTFATLAPCVNLNKVVFGLGQSFDQWLAEAENALARRPSEVAMFMFLKDGWFRGAAGFEAPWWVRAALRMTFGGSMGGTCAAQIGGMDMVGSLE